MWKLDPVGILDAELSHAMSPVKAADEIPRNDVFGYVTSLIHNDLSRMKQTAAIVYIRLANFQDQEVQSHKARGVGGAGQGMGMELGQSVDRRLTQLITNHSTYQSADARFVASMENPMI